MLKRYTRDEMGKVWLEKNKFRNWLLVEICVLRARQKMEELPFETISLDLIEKVCIDPEEINRIEEQSTGHDMVAFLLHVSPQLPEELRPWLHRGLTSYDVEDTALSLQLRDSLQILFGTLVRLMGAVREVAMKYKYVPEVGRTHGIHAEPITFGVKCANWYDELHRHLDRLDKLSFTICVGKMSGAVGMYTLHPKVEELVCADLGLKPIISTQIISRDIIAEYMGTLGLVAATIGKIATNLRLLSQTEIREVMEPFGVKQKGSSAMPHKKNPILCERIAGLARIILSNVHVPLENLSTCWHERSLDNSSNERVAIVDSSILLDYIMAKLTGILEKMRVFPERMMTNLDLTRGLIFSQDVMMLVAEKSGLPREEAHTLVRDIALRCWENGADFLKVLLDDESIMQFVSEEELRACFNLHAKLQYTDYIFKRVFG